MFKYNHFVLANKCNLKPFAYCFIYTPFFLQIIDTRWVAAGVVSILFTLALGIPDYAGLPPGPYCRARGCCSGRQDQCSTPIIGTLCYCDDFCNRTREEDCCPDFWSHCKGVYETTPYPAPEPIYACTFNGQIFAYKKTIKKNCNVCKCELTGNKAETLCEQDQCLIEPEITNTVNQLSNRYGWTARNYSEFWGKKLDEGIQLRLGTLQPHRFVIKMNPVRKFYDPNALPRKFNAEEKWPGLISHVQDQGWCGSSWAISTAAVASDRFAVLSKGIEKVKLSAQHLISCDNRGQQSCHGGYLDRAWSFIRKYGIVDEDCFPYTGKSDKCHIPRRGNLLTARCTPPQDVDRTDKYRVSPAYRLGNETDIMFEILTSGPVQATMKVYHDFFAYSGGIYKHTDLSISQRTGYHSVRIVGWGEEYTYEGIKKYWKIANSWGPQWGEDGYFRIVRGTNECDIESFVLATWPEIQQEVLISNEIRN